MLSSGERQVRGHQNPKRSKRVVKRVGDQTVRRHDHRGLAITTRMNWLGILGRVKLPLRCDGPAQFFIRVGYGDCLDPGHVVSPFSSLKCGGK